MDIVLYHFYMHTHTVAPFFLNVAFLSSILVVLQVYLLCMIESLKAIICAIQFTFYYYNTLPGLYIEILMLRNFIALNR
jgi:hypothetical protein